MNINFFLLFFLYEQALDQQNTNEGVGSGFTGGLPGGQLLSAALGVTRAVTQFLGAALQVCRELEYRLFELKVKKKLHSFSGCWPNNTIGMVDPIGGRQRH